MKKALTFEELIAKIESFNLKMESFVNKLEHEFDMDYYETEEIMHMSVSEIEKELKHYVSLKDFYEIEKLEEEFISDALIKLEIENADWNYIQKIGDGLIKASEIPGYVEYMSKHSTSSSLHHKLTELLDELKSFERYSYKDLSKLDWSISENRNQLINWLNETVVSDSENDIYKFEFKECFKYEDFVINCPATLFTEAHYDCSYGLYTDLDFLIEHADEMELFYVLPVISENFGISEAIRENPIGMLELLRNDEIEFYADFFDKKNLDITTLGIPDKLLPEYTQRINELQEFIF